MSVPVTPRFQFKASPFPGAAASFGDVGAEEELETSLDEAVEQHEWAGDLFEEGTESDPADAYALFKGPGGEEAWLDRAEDGTLTAWVRDTDGSVYRYSDPEAWAVDTDESGMGRVDPAAAADQEGDVEGEEPLEGDEDPVDIEDDLSDEAGFADEGSDVEGDLDDELDEDEDLEDEVDLDAAEAEVEADVAAVEGDLVDELAAEGADPDDIADAAVDVAEAVDEAAEQDPDVDEEDEDEDDWVSKLEGKGLASTSSAHRWSVRFGDR